MATYDQIALGGANVAGAIELHGALARGVAHTAEVIGALFMLEADVVFINAFYQLRSTDALAQALVQALDRPERTPPGSGSRADARGEAGNVAADDGRCRLLLHRVAQRGDGSRDGPLARGWIVA